MDASAFAESPLQPSLYPNHTPSARKPPSASPASSATSSQSSRQHTCVVPSQPRQPLATARSNMPDASASSTRLKRLSLLSRPPVPNADVSLDGEAPGNAASTGSTPGTPQRSKTGLRTSILYSPAASEAVFSPRSTSTRHGKQTVSQSDSVEDDTARQRFKSETGNSSQRRMARTTETLVEK